MGDEEIAVGHLPVRQRPRGDQVGAVGCVQAAVVDADEAQHQEQDDKEEKDDGVEPGEPEGAAHQLSSRREPGWRSLPSNRTSPRAPGQGRCV